jgi:diguanylate cyclase (GGDEF)-like protein
MWVAASWADRTPHLRLLGALQVIACLITLPFAALHLDPLSYQAGEVAIAAFWLALGGFSAFVAPRLGSWALDLSLACSSLLLAYSALITPHEYVQILDGLGMIVVGVFAAYTLPLERIAGFLFVSAASFTTVTIANPLLAGTYVVVIVLAMLMFNTMHVWWLVQRLLESSLVDPLTGALNRRGLSVKAPTVRFVADRAGTATSVAVIDLDRFKEYNDRNGHAAGDALLTSLVRAWESVLRPSDLIARMGGDEFVLVLPNCTVPESESLLSRLRAASPCSWTAGTVKWGSEDGDIFAVVDQGDRQMYRGKRTH